MVHNPELEDFHRQIQELREHTTLVPHLKEDELRLADLSVEEIARLIREDAGYYFLIAAARMNRTSVKKSMAKPTAQIVPQRLRKGYVIQENLPVRASFEATAKTALTTRERDLGRKRRGTVEQLFRERLKDEGIPLLMSPPVRQVPGLLIGRRKPDGVWPDPAEGLPPKVYLEVKNVRRVSDDIQKRLYEIAEASLEMKSIYGELHLEGLGVKSTLEVAGNSELRSRLREQILVADPVIVALLICSREEAERYREGAQTFIDRVFFQEEIQECLDFLSATIKRFNR